uniref:Integrase core domain containing protein n=1 Tax=Solanum tuberosum TaxID=4113 RepID=M1DGT9_SOLTU
MPSVVDVEIRKEDDVVEVREESENATEKKAEISQKVVPIPRPPPPFPQRSFGGNAWVCELYERYGDKEKAASGAPSSSRSTLPLEVIVVPLARVQKLEAQMATLLHHIQPWMQKSIAESEARMEQRMEDIMDRKIHVINKRLDAFELRVLERPSPTIDLSSFQIELASLRDDIDAILATPTAEPQAAPTALADDTVLDALFSGTAEEGPEPTHTKGKRHRSSCTEEEKSKKRQSRQKKKARKDSILDEELRQRRVCESVAGASSYAPIVEIPPVVRDVVSTTDGAVRVTESTTEGAMMDDVGTTEGDPSMVPVGSGKLDPPVCS